MRSKIIVAVVILLLIGISASAQNYEWKNKIGVGVRAGLYAPMSAGSGFNLMRLAYQGSNVTDTSYYTDEPFGMAFDMAIEVRYGVLKNMTLNLGVAFAKSYDDSTATGGQSFAFTGTGDAIASLKATRYSLTANYYFNTNKQWQPFVLGGFSYDLNKVHNKVMGKFGKAKDLSFKFGAGMNYWWKENISLDLQLRYSIGISNMSTDIDTGIYGPGDWSESDTRPFKNSFEPSIGIAYYFGGAPDTDKDGVKDINDQCPETPIGARVDMKGCPLDTDGDGVFDGLDLCISTPRGARVDINGCPIDSDKDGVFDGLDKCADTPEGVKVDGNGCPFDSDKDGVYDYMDNCANTQAGVIVDNKGCGIDSDSDGIFDGLDKCPGTPAGFEVKADGCPLLARVEKKITLSKELKYASGAFDLSDEGKTILNDIAQRIIAYPDSKIKISGYTDASGSAEFNLELSQKRAKAVLDYLAAQGVPVERMSSTGFGEDPQYFIGNNANAEGRAMNRRVEIETVQ